MKIKHVTAEETVNIKVIIVKEIGIFKFYAVDG